MSNILITGGAGFIGCNLVLELAKQNCNIVVVDDFKNSYVAHIQTLAKHFSNIKYFKGNCCDEKFMHLIFKSSNFDTVIHLAAKKYIRESMLKPKEYMNNNMNSLKTVLKLSKKYCIKRVIFPSSASVYGNCDKIPIDEQCPLDPLNPYSKTRVLGEELLTKWSNETNTPVTIFRFSNPIGANTQYFLGDHSKRHQMQLVPYVISKALLNEEIVLRGNNFNTPDGTPIRDFVYVCDLAKIVAQVVLSPQTSNVEIFNLGSGGDGYSTRQIVETTQQVLNKPVKYSFTDSNKFEVAKIISNSSELFNRFNINLTTPLEEIISSQISFQKHIDKNFK